MKSFNEEYKYKIEITTENLPIGDIIVCDDKNNEKLIIERKTLNDLAASIRDGRYSEQSFRLENNSLHNHNIMFLIEGDINRYSGKYSKISAGTLHVTMFCIQYFKGFSLMKTRDVVETAEFILRAVDKLSREKHRENYYTNGDALPVKNNGEIPKKTYTDVVSKVKKKNIRPDNVGEIILSQIPGISSVTSKLIMGHFNSLYDLLENIKQDRHCLDHLEYVTKTGGTRKISQTVVKKIIQYLLYQKNPPVIKIE
jgi:ERCC4-type nuclease